MKEKIAQYVPKEGHPGESRPASQPATVGDRTGRECRAAPPQQLTPIFHLRSTLSHQ